MVLQSAGLRNATGQWAAFVVGAVGIVVLARVALPFFLAMTDSNGPLRPQMFSLGLFAWLLGGMAVLVLMIPAFRSRCSQLASLLPSSASSPPGAPQVPLTEFRAPARHFPISVWRCWSP